MKTICKRTFHSKLVKTLENNKILFEKDKIYEFNYEDDERIWVIYDKNGGLSNSGIRFHTNKRKIKVVSLHNFYKYFYTERAIKLKTINGLNFKY